MNIYGGARVASAALGLTLLAAPHVAFAQVVYSFNLPPQPMADSLRNVGSRARVNIAFDPAAVRGKTAPPLRGSYSAEEALRQLTVGTGLRVRIASEKSFLIEADTIRIALAAPAPTAAHAVAALAEPLAGAPAENPGASVEEVIVTAQKRREALETVPMSVTVVTPETVAKAGINSFMDLGRVATGAQMNFAGGVAGVAVRGVSTLISGYNVEANVAVYIDGFYDPNPITMVSDVANLESLQVLKGPQGTLYGRNATGGAFLINTLRPSHTFTGKFDASYGRFNDQSFNGFVAGPINDRLRYSVATHLRQSDTYIKKIDPTAIGRTIGSAAKIKEGAVRAKLEADLTDDVTVTLGANYGYTQDSRPGLLSVFEHVSPAEPAPPLRPTEFGTAAFNRKNKAFGIKSEITAKLVYNTPVGDLTSYTGYARRIVSSVFDFDGSYADLIYNKFEYDQDTFQQAVDYRITAIDKLDLVVGGLYYHDLFKSDPDVGIIQYGANGALTSISQARQVTRAWALYVDGSYSLTPRLTFTAGGRYSHDRKSFAFRTVAASGVTTFAPAPASQTWTRFTPRVSLRYELAPRTSVYGSWTRGFRSGAYNGSPPANQPLTPVDPENIDAFEVGFKTAQRRIRFQSAAFFYNYKDLQVSVTVPNPTCAGAVACGIVTVLQNAPGGHIYGWENEVTFTPTERLTLRAGVALLRGRYQAFRNATGTGVNAANTLNVSNQIQDWTGKQMARAPDVSGNVSIDYDAPISHGSLLLSANLNFTSGYAISNPSLYGPLAPPELREKQRFRQSAYQLLSAQATWTDPTERYFVTLYGSNLTNKTYRLTYNGGSFGDYSVKAEPRSYGGRVGFRF